VDGFLGIWDLAFMVGTKNNYTSSDENMTKKLLYWILRSGGCG
jgi:hypothetical protein